MPERIANCESVYHVALVHIFRIKRTAGSVQRRGNDKRVENVISMALSDPQPCFVGIDRQSYG